MTQGTDFINFLLPCISFLFIFIIVRHLMFDKQILGVNKEGFSLDDDYVNRLFDINSLLY